MCLVVVWSGLIFFFNSTLWDANYLLLLAGVGSNNRNTRKSPFRKHNYWIEQLFWTKVFVGMICFVLSFFSDQLQSPFLVWNLVLLDQNLKIKISRSLSDWSRLCSRLEYFGVRAFFPTNQSLSLFQKFEFLSSRDKKYWEHCSPRCKHVSVCIFDDGVGGSLENFVCVFEEAKSDFSSKKYFCPTG